MAFRTPVVARTKAALICVLALLLLVAPVCGALCKAQACSFPETSEQAPCHESAGPMTAAADSVHAERSCALQELPVALPADFRSLRSGSALAADSATLLVNFASTLGHTSATFSPEAFRLPGTGALYDISASPLIPLRI